MRRTLSHYCICILFGLLSAAAVADPLATEAYRQSLQAGVDGGAYDQLAVGWIDGDQRSIWFYGKTAKPDASTRFEIGALTEVFTGLLLAQAEFEVRVQSKATLGSVLPSLTFADTRIKNLSIAQLVTHHSLLPSVPPNLFPADVADPYADFNDADLVALLRHYRSPTDESGGYTPLDFATLSLVLGKLYEQPFRATLVQHVLDPLGMSGSGFQDATITGHSLAQSSATRHYGALSGAVGMRATVNDLLTFLQSNLQPQTSPMRAAILISRQPHGDDKAQVGLGWNIADIAADQQSWPMVWRASTTAGFSAFMGFRTDRQQALVILGNSDADLSQIGVAWLQAQDAPGPPPPFVSAPLSKTIVAADYGGLYRSGMRAEWIVRGDGDRLTAQLQGSPMAVLSPLSDDVFIARADGTLYSFQRESGKVTSVLMARNGVNLLAQRLTPQAPFLNRKVISVSEAKLTQLVGDYRLDTLTLARVTNDRGGLNLQLTGRSPIALAAFSADHFTDADNSCEVSFVRNRDGVVSDIVIDFGGIERRGAREAWSTAGAKQ